MDNFPTKDFTSKVLWSQSTLSTGQLDINALVNFTYKQANNSFDVSFPPQLSNLIGTNPVNFERKTLTRLALDIQNSHNTKATQYEVLQHLADDFRCLIWYTEPSKGKAITGFFNLIGGGNNQSGGWGGD